MQRTQEALAVVRVLTLHAHRTPSRGSPPVLRPGAAIPPSWKRPSARTCAAPWPASWPAASLPRPLASISRASLAPQASGSGLVTGGHAVVLESWARPPATASLRTHPARWRDAWQSPGHGREVRSLGSRSGRPGASGRREARQLHQVSGRRGLGEAEETGVDAGPVGQEHHDQGHRPLPTSPSQARVCLSRWRNGNASPPPPTHRQAHACVSPTRTRATSAGGGTA